MNIRKYNNEKVDAVIYLAKNSSDLPELLKEKVDLMVASKRFEFKNKAVKVFYGDYDEIVVGFEDLKNDERDFETLRVTLSNLSGLVKDEKYSAIKIVCQVNFDDYKYSKTLAEMFTVYSYDFDKYLSDKKSANLKEIYLANKYDEKAISEGCLIGENVNTARRLVDEPSIYLYPEVLANEVVKLGKEYGYEVEVKGYKEIKELGMNAFLAVGQGSAKEPRLIVARYNGDPNSSEILGLVGKGITYDAGGLSIKPTNSMITMKSDMAGAAAVIGAISLIAQAKLKINVTAVVAACENLISGDSYKPGDIVKTMKGKTIFIGNTDAEGRVTLVDSVYYTATVEKVSKIIDLATLTGAAIVALGDLCAASMTNNQEFLDKYHQAAKATNEVVWQLPLQDMYREDIKHYEADFINTASLSTGTPGVAAGALLIEEFTEGKDWIHLDIAGPAHMTRKRGYYSKGATGFGVRSLYEFAKNTSKE